MSVYRTTELGTNPKLRVSDVVVGIVVKGGIASKAGVHEGTCDTFLFIYL